MPLQTGITVFHKTQRTNVKEDLKEKSMMGPINRNPYQYSWIGWEFFFLNTNSNFSEDTPIP